MARSLFAFVNGKDDVLTREDAQQNFIRVPPRRCLAMKTLYPRDLLVRFVLAREEQRVPDQKEEEREKDTKPTTWWVVPDVYEKSLDKKGKACYVSSSPLALGIAIKTNAFRNAFPKKSIKVPEDLIEVVQKGLKQRALSAFVKAAEKASAVVETALEDDQSIIEQTRRNQSEGELSTTSVLDRIRAQIDAFDSIRKHIHQGTIVIKPKVDENKGNIKNEKKNGIIVCDAFSVEELLGALESSSEGRGNNGTAITNIKERLRSSNNNNEKFLTLKGVPNKELFALQVSLMRYSGFDQE